MYSLFIGIVGSLIASFIFEGIRKRKQSKAMESMISKIMSV